MSLPREIRELMEGRRESVRVFKSGPGSKAFLACRMAAMGRSVVWVVENAREFREARALIRLFSPEGPPNPARPAWEEGWAYFGPFPAGEPEPEPWAARWAALYGLALGRGPKSALVCADNLLAKWPAKKEAVSTGLDLALGDEIGPELLVEQAVAWGFRLTPLVSRPGEMARRGDIVDLFAPGYLLPARFDFFGDTLEDIRLFDPSTQRSKASLPELTLLPTAPAMLSEESGAKARAWWERLRKTGEITANTMESLLERLENMDGCFHPGVFGEDACPLAEHLPRDAVFILGAVHGLNAALKDAEWGWREHQEKRAREKLGRPFPKHLLFQGEAAARTAWQGKPKLVFEELVLGEDRKGLDLPETAYESFSEILFGPQARNRPWAALTERLGKWRRERHQVVLSFHTEAARRKFLALAEPAQLAFNLGYAPDTPGLFALVSPLAKGMDLVWERVLVLSEDVLRPEGSGVGKRTAKDFKGLAQYDDLKPGELLVHRDFGLARFDGLTKLRVGDVAGDYLLLLYSGEDKLYVPVDRLALVARYKGPEGASPALDSLRGVKWKSAQERARKAVEKIAHDLVRMYALRKVAKGYGYGPVDEMFREFEASFGFEETPDQDRAVREVLLDMEGEAPMDRLVCGDVGFGKTEVALRAAFRAVGEGRQVALLCPTTVLAEQHYQTFQRRMAPFPVKVEMLSRFVPKPTQKRIVAAASMGEVDVLIGTHRLLSKDVTLPNLGLLVLDEEQRFGVSHKEKLKKFRQTVDVLTLTATPIPRTLQLSLSGVRSLSVIETPPADRKAVETAIVERDQGMLSRVLKRELERGGQVFWVRNRVQGLERVAEFVRELAPEARVGMAHGQMHERDLERVMHNFWHKELDVLVCTAIVESGLDFPNANTLVVDQAQMFGLGQLYQLRGRVGRSERQAYAYFVVPDPDKLGETARKRLQIILDMDYLGAGFRIAMEDLRIRGAGNILGEAQSGQIARVGLDLFLEMLEEEVARQKGEKSPRRAETEVNFVFEARLPESFVPDAGERLEHYRRLSACASAEEVDALGGELADRYGALPEQAGNFLALLRLKIVLARLRATRADLFPARAVLAWEGEAEAPDPAKVLAWLEPRSDWARLKPPASLEMRCDQGSVARTLDFLARELSQLALDDERTADTGAVDCSSDA